MCYTFALCFFSCIPAFRNQFSVHFPTGGGAVTLSCHRGAIFPTRFDLCPSSSPSLCLTPSFTHLSLSKHTHIWRHKLPCHINNSKCTDTQKNFANFSYLTHTHKSCSDKYQAITGMYCTPPSLSLSHTHCSISPLNNRTLGHRAAAKGVTLAEKPAGHLHSLPSHRLHPSHHGSALLSVCPAVCLHQRSFKNVCLRHLIICAVPPPSNHCLHPSLKKRLTFVCPL